MSEQISLKSPGFRIEIADDALSATLWIDAGVSLNAAEVIARVRELKIKEFDDGLIVEALEKEFVAAVSMNIARGVASVDERPAKYLFCVPFADGSSRTVSKVDAERVVATIVPPVPGTDGHNIFQEPIPFKKSQAPMSLGRGLKILKEKLVSTSAGNLHLYKGCLSVEPLLVVQGDDHAKLMTINFDGDVIVKGSLRDGHSLVATGGLTVNGAVEAVQLKIGRSLHVSGGIIGREKGRCVVGGDVICRFISGASIYAGGDVTVQSEILHSKIICTGKLVVSHGPISGGIVCANGGVKCESLGNESGNSTIVEAGIDQSLRGWIGSAYKEVEVNRKRVTQVKNTIAPLLQHMKKLTSQQKERATELMFEADSLERETDQLVAKIDARGKDVDQRAGAQVAVVKAAYPGVTVRFKGVETTLRNRLRGPGQFAPGNAGAARVVLYADETGASSCALDSHAVIETSITRVQSAKKVA